MRFFAIALSIAAFSTLARSSQAASINCLLRSHPVCVAVFAAYPPGGANSKQRDERQCAGKRKNRPLDMSRGQVTN
jgi:hypothetical protein